MRVEVRLFATLIEYAAGSRVGDSMDIELPAQATLTMLLNRLGVPATAVHLTLVNGRPVHDHGTELQSGDRVGLFPPVGGG